YLSTGTGFERFDLIEHFSNEGGWRDMKYWPSIRLVDFDGDGRADVCARFFGGIRCLRSTEDGFGDLVAVAGLSDSNGWSDPTNHLTIRAGDVNGDGAQNICARANAGMRCYGLDGEETFSITGPEWSNASGWDKPEHYHTVVVTDIDADRRRDLCARASAGLVCARATDEGFERISNLESFTNAQGWNHPKHYSTLRLGSGECRAEQCNGFDDNCDGTIDSGQPTQMGPTPPAFAARLVETNLPDQASVGEVVEATVYFVNEGSSPWLEGQVSLEAVANDETLIAALRPATGWPQANVAAVASTQVAPGDVGAFTFPVRVPESADVFDRVLFMLVTEAAGPINCPAPNVTLQLGITTDDGESGASGNDDGTRDNESDAGHMSDVEGGESQMQSASHSSCASVDSGPPGSWPGLLAVMMGLFWLRRRRSSDERGVKMTLKSLLSIAVLAGISMGMAGCESASAPPTEESETKTAEAKSELVHDDYADPSARINSPTARLLAVYGDWEFHGTLQPLLPHSDAPGELIVELRHQDKVVAWPLGDEPISNAVFVPPASTRDGAPTLAVRTSVGRLIHVDPSKNTAVQLDEEIGLMVSAAANGCCIAYMRGEMGLQTELAVATLDGGAVQRITLDENSWSPAISPDGTQVVYVSATPAGNAQIVLREISGEGAVRVLVEDAQVFATGPQPPFWTDEGIAFASEHGAYLLDLEGRLTVLDAGAHGLLVDLSDGRFIDAGGKAVKRAD
ncbi:MAG: FG-GAP-like repeat-containing protein, partial [Bradymonadaceae bacterium]